MFSVERDDFVVWMQRIWEKLENIERKVSGKEKEHKTINGEKLLDNQDLCFMLNVSKRTLQRFRSSGILPYHRIEQKLYYLESDVIAFLREHMKQVKKEEK